MAAAGTTTVKATNQKSKTRILRERSPSVVFTAARYPALRYEIATKLREKDDLVPSRNRETDIAVTAAGILRAEGREVLDIRLLGPPVVTVDGTPIDVDTKKAVALLAYLAIEGSAERDALSTLFWADSSPERARATLRRTLSALRGGIGANSLDADRQRVTLTADHVCDATTFTALVGETTDHGHADTEVCARCVAPLAKAAELYRGDFLGTFHVRDAPDFEDWARPVAESMRIEAGDVFQRLAMAHAGNGDYSAAISTTNRWIRLDDLHEPAHRQLMLLHAWAGDRPGAMEAYNACVAILDRELGVSPLEETTELFEAILDEDLPPAPAQRRPTRPVRTVNDAPTHDMIDRHAAVGMLENALDSTEETGQVCVITGDSWMGKTRLIEHLHEMASSRGFGVVSGRSFRAESGLPYAVATQILQGLLALKGETEIDDWVTLELARLEPRLAPGQTLSSADRQGQLRLAEALLSLVDGVADRCPVVVTVDDLQWVDPASAALLSYLVRRMERSTVLLVIGSRTLDGLPEPLDDLASVDASFIHLAPLVSGDLSDLTEADLEPILLATGGIPLLVKEALDTGITPSSPSVLRYMESRRNRLSDLSRQVLAAASVLDGMCDAGLLRDTSGRTDEEIVEAVEELVAGGLLREESDGLLSFTLDVLETVTYEGTSLIRRRLLHRRAAEAIEARPRARSDARLATAVAGHLRNAGSDEAAEWYRLAGDLARSVFANDEATVSYETAIALDHTDVAGLRLGLGELAMARGDYPTATRELRAAAAQSSAGQLALVEHRQGDLNRILGRFDLAEENFASSEADHPEPAELYADWALLRHRIGDSDGAVDLASRAATLAEELEDPEVLARTVNILGVVTSTPEDALNHLDRALDLVEADDPARMAALNNKAHLIATTGDPESARELVAEAIEIARRSGYRHHQAALLNHLADLHHAEGNEDSAEAALTEAVTIFADIVADDWEPEVWLMREW